ncbi:substrate-binding periplasmic protein [Alishewanella longhuensis]|uniref:substrate-binding periplasmic protein n=1 Tax=Alishewanella longhuensis TaxID=1091037 RepID=UPI001E384CB6|nr:transporter substrate-binding domain-containing protein [Alishewanella longhuensis]
MIAVTPVSASDTIDQGDSYQVTQQAQMSGLARTIQLTVLYVPAEGFAYINPQGQLTGVSVEIMQDFASWLKQQHQLAVQLNFVSETNWQQFYQRIVHAQGGVFGLGNVTITEPRKQELAFSPPYLHNIAALITHQDISPLPEWQALPKQFAKLKPLAFSGTLHEQRINRLRDQYQPNAIVQQVSSNPDLLAKVASGQYYAYVDAYNYWRAREAGMPLRDHPIAAESGETFGFIMPHSNDWAGLLEAFFAADGGYLQSPRYQQVLTEQLGAELAQLLLKNQSE